jgi:hypothetical protein
MFTAIQIVVASAPVVPKRVTDDVATGRGEHRREGVRRLTWLKRPLRRSISSVKFFTISMEKS